MRRSFSFPQAGRLDYPSAMSAPLFTMTPWISRSGHPGCGAILSLGVLTAATAVCAVVGGWALDGIPRLGFAWRAADSNIVVTVVDPNGPAARTRLSSGDRLLSLNDIALDVDDALIYPEINRRAQERTWWQRQQRIFDVIASGQPVDLLVQQGERAPVTIQLTPHRQSLREILSPYAPLYMNAALQVLLAWLILGRSRGPAQLLCAFLSAFCALNYVCYVPLAARNPGLAPDIMRWFVLAFYVAAGGNITLVHFSLIFPKPKAFLLRFPRIALLPYIYFAASVILYGTGAIAFGSTFPFLVAWVVIMISALLHTMFSQTDPFLRQQALLAALAPLYVGLFYVLLTLLPTVVRITGFDYALFASVTLILPFTLAFAAETTDLYAAMRREEAGVQAERLRISRDLHDSVGGDLTAIKLFAEEAEAQHPDLPPSTQGLVRSIRETAVRSLMQVRGFIWAIDPRECNWTSFAQRINRTGQHSFGPLGIDFSFACDVLPGIPPQPHLLYQIMGVYQEALNNILKHANAAAVEVRLDIGPSELMLSVRDNGRGIAHETPGYGSRSMRERAASIGATLAINNATPRGTEIVLHLRKNHSQPRPPAETSG